MTPPRDGGAGPGTGLQHEWFQPALGEVRRRREADGSGADHYDRQVLCCGHSSHHRLCQLWVSSGRIEESRCVVANISINFNAWQDGGMTTLAIAPAAPTSGTCCAPLVREAADPAAAADLARSFKALGDPTRVRLLSITLSTG